jgi:hypothetical protein
MRLKTNGTAYVAATLQNVLYVPDLSKQPGGPIRLFSASSAADQSGAEVTTGANTRITLRNGLVIPGRRQGKHFFIDAIPGFLPDIDAPVALLTLAAATPAQQQSLWHARMCHMNHVAVDKVLRAHSMAPKGVIQPTDLFCETCALIKRKVANISRSPQERPTTPFSFVGLDFWETRDESLQGNRYVFGAVCYATSVVYTVFLPSRKPGPACLKQLSSLAQSYGFALNRIRLDNDTVFHSHQFHELVTALSLRLEFSAPHSQYQNGLIERTWGTLSQWTLCMLSHAELAVGY